MTDRFGALVTGADIARAATTTLQAWLPTWLAELERRKNKPPRWLPVPDPRSYRTVAEEGALMKFPEQSLPAVFVVSPGLVGPPTREHMDGVGRVVYRAQFALTVAVIASAREADETDLLTKLYVAAISGVMLGQQTLGGLSREVEWMDEEYLTRHVEERTRGLAQATFSVDVPDARTTQAGPPLPDDPYVAPAGFPTVQVFTPEVEPNPDPRGT